MKASHRCGQRLVTKYDHVFLLLTRDLSVEEVKYHGCQTEEGMAVWAEQKMSWFYKIFYEEMEHLPQPHRVTLHSSCVSLQANMDSSV